MAGRARNWTAAERLYLSDYLQSGARAKCRRRRARYTLLKGVTAKGQALLVIGDEVEAVKGADGQATGTADRRGNQGWA